MIEIYILGDPVPQGRPRFARRGNFTMVYDPPKSKAWKKDIIRQVNVKGITPLQGPLSIQLSFHIKRPKKPTNPYPVGDVDNYVKGVKDALNKLAYKDDAQIVFLTASKEYVKEGLSTGVRVIIKEIKEVQECLE